MCDLLFCLKACDDAAPRKMCSYMAVAVYADVVEGGPPVEIRTVAKNVPECARLL